MPLRAKRYLFYTGWFLLLSLGPITVYLNTNTGVLFTNDVLLLNVFQRVLGLLAFTLIFIQILLGSMMGRWLQIIGSKAYLFHTTQGLLAYGFILAHPFMYTLINYKLGATFFELIASFVPKFSPRPEIYITFGRMGFVLFTVGVVAAYFRTKPFFRRNWLKFHLFNYVGFYAVWFHARNIGSDVQTPPFSWFFNSSIFVVSALILWRIVVSPVTKLAKRFFQQKQISPQN